MEVDPISLQLGFLLISTVAFQLCASSQPVYRVFGRQLLISTEGVNTTAWDDSETYCGGYKGNLAALTSLLDLNFVHEVCNRSVGGCWVGGRMLNISTGVGWFWSDNTSRVDDSIFPAEQLSSNYARNLTDSCLLLTYGLPKLMAESCNKSHAFICMTDMGTASS